MLLTISTTTPPATDLGYLLHKHPAKRQTFELAFGCAHVFYPDASDERTTAALLLDIDPVGMVRNRRGPRGDRGVLDQYVNDRPYVASSFLSVAIAQTFSTAMGGRCKDKPEAVDRPLALEARVAVVPCRGGEATLRRLFEPLAYDVEIVRHPLDERFPDWGDSPYFTLTLRATRPLRELLAHLYVLLPVLDNDKHYWVGDDEVEKLLRFGEGWLANHPEKEEISRRYLKWQKGLARRAIDQLTMEESPDVDAVAEADEQAEEAIERPISLNEQRHGAVLSVLDSARVTSVIDLGCAEGRLVRAMMKNKSLERIVGLDVSHAALQKAADRLRLERMSPTQRSRIELMHGSLTYRDDRLKGFDAATVIEVIEHLDPPRLAAFERVLFEFARPSMVVVTTPNAEYNVKWETLPAGSMRHHDHRFEWTRSEFQAWAKEVAERFGYEARFLAIGPEDAAVGAPTQMGLFEVSSESTA
ncbi:MAG TPA: 3' terminal RNA ribose 2'-O-methyltransferase Hen1 [Phycisphaerae bacterium]|nr:3' terminal RNA ribose 2'-O-methyltransferase Hen1 [Phycisphaerae bacterium]